MYGSAHGEPDAKSSTYPTCSLLAEALREMIGKEERKGSAVTKRDMEMIMIGFHLELGSARKRARKDFS